MKREYVKNIFSSVSQKYDLMNDLMSLGIHRKWKKNFVSSIGIMPGQTILDMAAGTGDITLLLLKGSAKPSEITMCDSNEQMLDVGKSRLIDSGYINAESVVGDALNLPFSDNTFDHYIVAFGLRNFPDIDASLAEAYRILKPGGKLSCLEFSDVKNPILDFFYQRYLGSVIPLIGEKVAKNKDAYLYLANSIKTFPSADSLLNLFRKAGFKRTSYSKMTSGVVAQHYGSKL